MVKENYQGTVNNMEMAVRLSTLRPDPYYVLAKTYMNLNEVKKAENINEEVLKFYPEYYEFYFYMASLKYIQQDIEKALINLRKTLSLLPTYTPAAEIFSNILLNQQYISKEDKELLENLIEILPYESNLPSYLAEIYFKESNCISASKFAFMALQKNIFDKPALKIFVDCKTKNTDDNFLNRVQQINQLKEKIKLKQNEFLLKDIKKLQAIYPDEPEVVSLLAEFYFRQEKYCKAEDILKQYKGNNFWGKSYNFSLSLSAQKCGDTKTQSQSLTEILDYCPYDELAKNKLKNVKI